ncbi:MAG TPA: DinB family protein [Sphingomonadales bacterium]|nr:DinB family protein [Sphingomonadales bacterium]
MNAAYFQTLARYNAWANRRLYAACGKLPEGVYLKERPSFFGSIHKTLNHVLAADRIWLSRFEKTGGVPKALDALLAKDFTEMKTAREAEDKRIFKFAAGLNDERVNAVFHYHDLKGALHAVPMHLCLAHFFNHQTHHRGQVHGMLSGEELDPPPLDIIYFALEELEGAKT